MILYTVDKDNGDYKIALLLHQMLNPGLGSVISLSYVSSLNGETIRKNRPECKF